MYILSTKVVCIAYRFAYNVTIYTTQTNLLGYTPLTWIAILLRGDSNKLFQIVLNAQNIFGRVVEFYDPYSDIPPPFRAQDNAHSDTCRRCVLYMSQDIQLLLMMTRHLTSNMITLCALCCTECFIYLTIVLTGSFKNVCFTFIDRQTFENKNCAFCIIILLVYL